MRRNPSRGLKLALNIALAAAAWEAGWWFARRQKRFSMYADAQALAKRLGKPLVVVGAPDRGATNGPGCGDMVIDIGHSSCPNFVQADICKKIPLADNSAVVFVSCVLEYVSDVNAAMRELIRVSGGNLFVARVEPWTLTAYLYPGAQRTLPGDVLPASAMVRAKELTA